MAVDYPCNFRFDSSNHILSWDGVPKAIEYEIIYKAASSSEWQICYSGGNDTSTSFNPQAGILKVKGRTKEPTVWSEYGPEETLTIPQ